MSCAETARAFALEKAEDLERKAHTIGILRSVDATEASRWLKDMAASIRDACGHSDEEIPELLSKEGGKSDV